MAHTVIYPEKVLCRCSPLIYGQFLEHFHRQVYGGIYDPDSPFSDSDGFRTDVLEALRALRVPVIRWPGGCFVSAYHWTDGVGPDRMPSFNKAWRVEEPNTFGTDEFIRFCRKLGCEPYFCTNAGTGTAEEMSDWVEYCNLRGEGRFARMRSSHGAAEPYAVRYWSIGNENYGPWEIGAKDADEWSRLVLEAAKMMKRVDPEIELSAAALPDLDWNLNLLRRCGGRLDWLSLHKYWDMLTEDNTFADYEQVMAYTDDLDADLRRVRGLLMALGLEKKIRIAYDEWNLRSWYHPNIMGARQGRSPEEYLTPRDENDRNRDYTMADAVFTACFLNTLHRNADLVGMANFSPVVNTRGCIFTHPEGIVLRSTYFVFLLYVSFLGAAVLDCAGDRTKVLSVTDRDGRHAEVPALDILPTRTADGMLAVAAVNKHPAETAEFHLNPGMAVRDFRVITVNGETADAYNDIGVNGVCMTEGKWRTWDPAGQIRLAPHSVSVVQLRT